MRKERGGDAVDHFITIWTVAVFVENRLQSGLDYAALEKATGLSLPHIRAVFAKRTGISLARYIVGRRIANAAFEIAHGEGSILDIAGKYGFSNPDTFTRDRKSTRLNSSH